MRRCTALKEQKLTKLPTKKKIKKKKIILSIIAAAAVLLVIAFYLVMTKSGHWLVDDDEFEHVSWIVVLDGQTADMERIDMAAELMASGKADSVLILGRRILRNRSNAEFYLEDFMRLGNFDSNAVFIARHDDPSTMDEAYSIIPWLKMHNADTVLLLTGAASTYRVKRIFTKLSGESPVYLTKDVHHYYYNPDSWYTHRESRKEWLRGWAALAASYIDLLPSHPMSAQDSFYYKPIVSAKEFEAEKNPVVNLQSLLPKVQEKIKEAEVDTTAKDTTAKASAKEAVKDSVVKESVKDTTSKKDSKENKEPKESKKDSTAKKDEKSKAK